MKQLLSAIIDIILLRFNFLSGMAEPIKFLSPELLQILENSGYHAKPEKNRVKMLFLVYNKRIIRPDLSSKKPKLFIPKWEESGLKKKIELMEKAIRKCTFYVDPTAEVWNMAVYRDKESKKISFFNFNKGQKKVVWVEKSHFIRELETSDRFLKHGVHVLGHESANDGEHSLIQKLVGIPGQHTRNFHPIDQELLQYVLETGQMKSMQFGDSSNLPAEIKELADSADQQIRKNFWIHNNEAPYTYVHGDVNPYNLLRNDGNTWLIDFDRSFEATVYYDFIYLWINKYDRDTEKLKNRIKDINTKFYGENVVPDTIGLSLALAFFVYDNIRFINDHCETIRDARFTIFLLNNVKSIWHRYQEIVEE